MGEGVGEISPCLYGDNAPRWTRVASQGKAYIAAVMYIFTFEAAPLANLKKVHTTQAHRIEEARNTGAKGKQKQRAQKKRRKDLVFFFSFACCCDISSPRLGKYKSLDPVPFWRSVHSHGRWISHDCVHVHGRQQAMRYIMYVYLYIFIYIYIGICIYLYLYVCV